MKHIGEKCVHLASTNMTTGRSRNTNGNILSVGTEWSDFSELVKSHKADLVAACVLLALCLTERCNSSSDSTRGDSLTKGEVNQMLTQRYRPELSEEWPYQNVA